MGSVCCCTRAGDFEDYANPNSYLSCFLTVCTAVFQRGQVCTHPSSFQGTSPVSSIVSHESFLSDAYLSPPRPQTYDADPRSFRLLQDGLVSRREKGSSHLHGESERTDIDEHLESLNAGDKLNVYDRAGSKECLSDSSVKRALTSMSSGVNYVYSSSEDEDVCPTCLEEYTPENPKIMTHCSHHFHLVCIYEWMERSESCPICGKLMEFDETT